MVIKGEALVKSGANRQTGFDPPGIVVGIGVFHMAGGGLAVKPCDAKSKSQVWQIDGQGRLVAHDGRCVAGDQLQKCGSGNAQKWQVDGRGRLANGAKQCLQAQGNPPKAGAKVVGAACSKAPNQVWQ